MSFDYDPVPFKRAFTVKVRCMMRKNDPDHYRWSLIEIFFAALILAAAVLVPAMLAAAMCGWVGVEGCR